MNKMKSWHDYWTLTIATSISAPIPNIYINRYQELTVLGSRNYDEKRNFLRLTMNCPISFQRFDGTGATKVGTCIDLSANGVKFKSDESVMKGAELKISVQPKLALSPPFAARLKVLRVEQKDKENFYHIAGHIDMIQ